MNADQAQSRLRAELIQVAAVAVAAIHDLDHGRTGYPWHPTENVGRPWHSFVDEILTEIYTERCRQENKWGNQHHDPTVWMSILMEEVGEAAQEAMRMTNEAVRQMDARKELA